MTGRPLIDVLDEAGLLDEAPELNLGLPNGKDPCDHRDLLVGLVEEGPDWTRVHYRCKDCGENIEKRYSHGYEGVGG